MKYNSSVIFKEESARDEKTQKLILEYKKKFLEQPHFEIKFHKKNVSFNPATLLSVEDKGTVYPTMQATDIWGTLTVTNGALMSPNQDKVTMTVPLKIEGNDINGDGWTLKLTEGYKVTKDENSGNYNLTKR